MNARSLRLVVLAAALIVHSEALLAQTTTGALDGYVRDPSQEPLAGVTVVASSSALIRGDTTVRSGRDGYYQVPTLPPGNYSLIFTAADRESLRHEEVIVLSGVTTTVDATMSVATVAEAVTVESGSPMIDIRNAKLAFTYGSELVENIPTGRTFHSLVSTLPGVESANNYGAFQPGAIELQNVLGSGLRANLYKFEGTNVTDPALQSAQVNLFSYDIIEEVQVVQAAKPAELGAQGGFFHVITKSGGNDLSGEVSAFYQSEDLQSDNVGPDLEAAVSSNRLQDSFDASASMGGPLVRDRLWWFGSLREQDTTSQLFDFSEDIEDEVEAYYWKNTYEPHARHRLTWLYNHWNQEVSHFFLDFAPALAGDPQASIFRPIEGTTYTVRWNGVASDRLIADFGWGRSDNTLDRRFQEGAGVPIIDLVTGERFRNHGDGSRDHDGENTSWDGSVSWFVPEAAGHHTVKLGGELVRRDVSILFDEIGDHRLNLLRGSPFAVRLLSTPSLAVWDIDDVSLYAQDTWTPYERLTLNLGLRFDRTHATTPEQSVSGGAFSGTSLAERLPQLDRNTLAATDLVTWEDVAPRIAATLALDDSARSVLRGSYSRYYHFLESFALFTSNPAFPFTFILRWDDRNGDREFQIGEEGALLSRFGGAINAVDPGLDRPYTDEITLGFSRQLFPDFLVTATAIYKKDRELLNTIDVGIPFDAYTPTEVPDPGEDGVLGTGDDGTLIVFAQDPATFGRRSLLLTNPPGDDRTYKGLEISASKRLSRKWQMVGSLVVSEMEVVKPSNPTSVTGLFDNPNFLLNAEGKDPQNQTVYLKLQGTYHAPFEILLSGFYRYSSGLPFTRELVVEGLPQGPVTVFAERRGSRETESSSTLDLRAEKMFRLRPDFSLGLILDVFNVTNEATVFEEGTRTGVDLGEPRAVRNPRIARLGLRLRW